VDDVVELLCYGADFVNIARGFMILAGCIHARQCLGANERDYPVGLATMNEAKRSKYLVIEKSQIYMIRIIVVIKREVISSLQPMAIRFTHFIARFLTA